MIFIEESINKYNHIQFYVSRSTLAITVLSLLFLIIGVLISINLNNGLLYKMLASASFTFFGWGLLALMIPAFHARDDISSIEPEKGSLAYEHKWARRILLGIVVITMVVSAILYIVTPVFIFYIIYSQ